MYKRAAGILILSNLIFLYGMVCVNSAGLARQFSQPVQEMGLDERVLATAKASTIGIVDTAISGQRVVELQRMEHDDRVTVSLQEEDLDLLKRIVEAEAGNQDIDGRLLVANVVLNRVASEKFPDSVKDVVLQETGGSYQFSPVANGRIWRVRVSEQTDEAVERALGGEDISDGALYFVARQYADGGKMQWFDNHLTYLFEWGGHEFFK